MYKDIEQYTDEQIIIGIINNDHSMIEYFFFKKCKSLFAYIIQSVFNYQIDENTLISELYIYLQANDWYKLKQFDYRSKLTTWTSVVAVRYFQKKRELLIESETSQALNGKTDYGFNPNFCVERRIDIYDALNRMQNTRYRHVIEMLDLKEMRPDLLAEQMNVTVDNLYNIHRRALLQLRMHIQGLLPICDNIHDYSINCILINQNS